METENGQGTLAKVNPLLDEQRQEAYEAARLRIAGKRPTYDDSAVGFSAFSAQTVRLINMVTYLVIAAAFTPSALRMFIAGFMSSAQSIPAFAAAIVVGYANVLLAEAGQLAFMLAASVTKGTWSKVALYVAAATCTVIALVGNAHVVKPWEHQTLFAWLEAFAPPLLVLVAANVKKTQILNANAARVEAYHAYLEAVATWEIAYETADRLGRQWERELANSLWNALRLANKRSPAVMRSLTNDDKKALVLRERSAEEWWDATTDNRQLAAPKQVIVKPVVTADNLSKADKVRQFLADNPDAATTDNRQLAAQIGGVSYETVRQVKAGLQATAQSTNGHAKNDEFAV